MIKVFVVILNWNQPGLTLECLESVGRMKTSDFELAVVVVDNASKDDSRIRLADVRLTNADYHFLANSTNLGYAGGNNAGIKYALSRGADYLLILNNDTLTDPGLIEAMLRCARSDPKIGAVTPKIYFAKGFEFHKSEYEKKDLGKVIWAVGGKVDWKNILGSNLGVDQIDRGQFAEKREVEVAVGTAAFYSRETLSRVGRFDEKYFLYYEDTDLSRRIKLAGYKIVYCPDAVVWHKVAQSSGIGSGLNDYYTTRNRMLFGMRYATLRTKFALMRESIRLLLTGRKWQKIGIRDYYLGRFGKGSFVND